MSLNTGFGELHNILDENPNHAIRLKTISPILMKEKFDVLLSFGDKKSPRYQDSYKNQTFDTTYESNLKGSLEDLTQDIIEAVQENGVRIIILSDKNLSKKLKTIPMAMAVGKINQSLLEAGIRHITSMVAISAEVYDPHSASVLIAYGATAIYPYLMYATIINSYSKSNLSRNQMVKKLKNSHKAINSGILKIMSKMGISTVASYRSSGLFDTIGLSDNITSECFSNSMSLLGGLNYNDIEERIALYHTEAFDTKQRIYPINLGGYFKYIANNEYHDFAPDVTKAMQKMADSGKMEDYDKFLSLMSKRELKVIRDFFEFNSDRDSIEIDEVESVDKIFVRFASAAMSLGSISPEAHEAIAVAMNTIGGQSNSGEGGEDSTRFGTIKNSKIKQVASGRFGVTPEYLVSAQEIQIKVAQGAKPGEGGQLPGHKVTPLIASLRYTIPGVTLISPPPHHDIYSIEDLAQLIFDLKQINPGAKITVKLVSTGGVGTIAAGVAKAYADKIIISGGDGGTGAAPLSSIKYAGNPWEIGLAEAHNALKVNHLRSMVHLQTDGGLKTGLDIIKAAILGAESYAFGTGVLVLLGCKILRICHTNKCTVGVATQEEELRDHFVGTVDRLVNYFTLIAQDIRRILASLGYKSLEDIIGKTELLKVIDNDFAKKFDFSSILMNKEGTNTCQVQSNEPYDKNEFEIGLVEEIQEVIQNPTNSIVLNKTISNINRSFGTRISGEIAKYYGNKGLADDSIIINLTGTAGQSFGTFLTKGISIKLNGAANDYVCKGMNGGKVVITPKLQGPTFGGAGNTCLYGATGGKLYVAGIVGERFAVRNSGAIAVVEGTGDHACEYMTDGVVVILGDTGVNFGAGMTGGVAFVYDANINFADKLNRELVEIIRIDTDDTDRERHYLKKLLKEYIKETGSKNAEYIIDNFRDRVRYFWMVKSKDMKSPLNPDEGD
jgi:glutamate synthase (NADPH/NADH) large chain